MKKICNILFLAFSAALLFPACQEIEEAPNEIPHTKKWEAPSIGSITATSAKVSVDQNTEPQVWFAKTPDMKNAEELEFTYDPYYTNPYGNKQIKWDRYTSQITGLTPNTTYYVQFFESCYCDEDEEYFYAASSPVAEFTTLEFTPIPYYISLSDVPGDAWGNGMGVFTIDANGNCTYEKVSADYGIEPKTLLKGASTIYLTIPYVSGATDPEAVPVSGGGDDFYYAVGKVDPDYPKLSLTPQRFTAHVNVKFNFKANNGDAGDVKFEKVVITNVDGNSPICLDGTLNLNSGEFTPSKGGRTEYVSTQTSYLKDGASVDRQFTGVIPVSFGEKAVKVVLTLSGDITDTEATLLLPADKWTAGSNVNLSLNAEYTAKGVELTLVNVEVMPWADGSTGNIDINK